MTRRIRDRRGRGVRGPALVPAAGPDDLAPTRSRLRRSAAERFDDLALGVMRDLWARFPDELRGVEVGVEEVPLLPDTWTADTVPLASFVDATAASPPRLVLLRRPIEHRAADREELAALVFTVMVEQVAEVLGIPPESVHPNYDPGEE